MSDTSKDARDTQFKDFARLLLEELMSKYDHLPPGKWGPAEKDELIIARRAYDLVKHAFGYIEVWNDRNLDFAVKSVPDMTELPKEQDGQV
jgi:hypothetical protein